MSQLVEENNVTTKPWEAPMDIISQQVYGLLDWSKRKTRSKLLFSHVSVHIPEKHDVRVVEGEVHTMSLRDECTSQKWPDLRLCAFNGRGSNSLG